MIQNLDCRSKVAIKKRSMCKEKRKIMKVRMKVRMNIEILKIQNCS